MWKIFFGLTFVLLIYFMFISEPKTRTQENLAVLRFGHSPMIAGSQLWGRAWAGKMRYDENSGKVDCDDISSAQSVSTCTVKLNPRSRSSIYPVADQLAYKTLFNLGELNPGGVWVNIKVKAWAKTKESYCQLTMKVAQQESDFPGVDFVQHVEVFRHSSNPLDARNVNYSTLPIFLNSNGEFFAKFSREIIGDCEVSVAVTVLGFF